MQPRGRKKELKGDTRRRELLKAIRKLLADGQDFSKLNVEAIARAAGMSRPTFYFYFESKYEALGAVITEVQSALIENSNILFEGRHDDPFDELRKAMKGVVDTWQKEGPLMQAFAQAAGSDPKLWQKLEDFVQAFIEPTAHAIVEIHKQQGRTTELPDATQLATALLWGNERNLYRAASSNSTKAQWQKLTETLTSIWTGAVLHMP